MTYPIAVLVSDLHLSHNPPAARSAEPDWYSAMKRQWDQVRMAAEDDHKNSYNDLPIVIAGDIFDVWRSPPELINFAIDLFRGLDVYAIPGQHDLPNHVYMDMYRSAYGTLVVAGAIKNLDPWQGWIPMPDAEGLIWMQAFPWGFEVKPRQPDDNGVVKLAVVHKYVWSSDKNKYPGAPDESSLAVLKSNLVGYDAAVFGDNHKNFLTRAGSCNVINCGGFMARKSDEREYRPGFGLLYSNGLIERVEFDRSKDKWVDPADVAGQLDEHLNLSELIGELESLGSDALNFVEILERHMDKEQISSDVRKLVIQALEKGREDAV